MFLTRRLFGRVSPWLGQRLSLARPATGGQIPTPFNHMTGGPIERKPRNEPTELVPCLKNLSPELSARLTMEYLPRKLKLESLKGDLNWISHRYKYPLPEELTETQWTVLLDMEELKSRVLYLNAVLDGCEEEKVEELQEEDSRALNPLQLEEDDVEELVGDDEALQEKLQLIKDTHERLRQSGSPVPVQIHRKHLKALLIQATPGELPSQLSFLALKDSHKAKDLIEKRARKARLLREKQETAEKRKEEDGKHIGYHLGKNTIYQRIYRRTMNQFNNWKAIQQFQPFMDAQPLIVDLQFLKLMNLRNANRMIMGEVLAIITDNRERASPAALYLVNYDPECSHCKMILDLMPTLMNVDEPCIVTEKGYLDMFPKERLLYLSPDSKVDMLDYNPEDVYIVAALNNKGDRHEPVTLAQAKREGIRHARLPLRRVLGRHLELTTNAVPNILADFRYSKNWNYACRWVPARFLRYGATNDSTVAPHYAAHHDLHPEHNPYNVDMFPKTYQRLYNEKVHAYAELHNIQVQPLSKKFGTTADKKRSDKRYNNSDRHRARGYEENNTKRFDGLEEDSRPRSTSNQPRPSIASLISSAEGRPPRRTENKKRVSVRNLITEE